MGLTCCHKTAVFYILYLQFFYLSTSVHSRNINIPIMKANGCYAELYFRLLAQLSSTACDLASAYKFLSELDDR